ncbi:hypothetical protein Forpe1208_v006910 [Fusarium oxysporum f. sp. rapae]|uniref:Uncharacterized protein n=1 Tax=Fusarium oxysporum f. sp. rapae TaxID=485398 RepID=A0A8J5P9T1_FUSOX|nr:hypothetical protein Forpe1208_v006910 [Fusarium oxysporum f. sp. rapae]
MAHHHGSGDGLEAGYYLRDTHKMEEMVDGCSDPSGSVPGQREAATAATSGRFIQGEQKVTIQQKREASGYTSRAGQSSSDRGRWALRQTLRQRPTSRKPFNLMAIQCRLSTTTLGGFVQGSLSQAPLHLNTEPQSSHQKQAPHIE